MSDEEERKGKCAALDGKYFTVIQELEGKVRAQWELCKPGIVTVISGSYAATTNFKTHLKRKHPGDVRAFELYKVEWARNSNGKRSLKRKAPEGNPMNGATAVRQSQLQFPTTKKGYSQAKFDELITKFVVSGMRPLSIVGDPSFINIFEGMDFGVKLIDRRGLGRRIKDQKARVIVQKLKAASYVSTTADIWSTKTRSFLGVTAYWIDEQTLKRHSAALACRRCCGPHTHDKIAEMLEDIHDSFGLSAGKIVSTITDNGANFSKAFKMFGVDLQVPCSDSESDFDEESDENFSVSFVSDHVEEKMEESRIRLPHHVRCASYTLNLLATTDAIKIIANSPPLSRVHHMALGKCTFLWNASGRPHSAEKIFSVLGQKLSYPGVTRWNSLYDALCQVLKHKEKLQAVFSALGTKIQIKEVELEYLREYCEVMRPIASSIDRLQGDGCFFGLLLPTLFVIKRKLEEMESKVFRYCAPLVTGLKVSLENRFNNYFSLSAEVNYAVLASCTHPFFKMRWLTNGKEELRGHLQQMLINAAKELNPEVPCSRSDGSSSEEDFFAFSDEKGDSSFHIVNKNEIEVFQFLGDKSKSLSTLHEYPAVKHLFVRYNTGLTSSAPVERLFSFAGFIYNCKRNNLADSMFETLLLLKENEHFL